MSGDEALDLTPRAPRSGGRRWVSIGIVAAVLAIIVVVMVKLLGDATLFVYEADAAVEKRTELGDDRFRLIGSPLEGTIVESQDQGQTVVAFSVVFEGVTADVVHIGDPPQLFQPGVPVFLEGRWTPGLPDGSDGFVEGANDGFYFASDTLRVKHDSDYRNDNEERISEAESGGEQ